MNIIESELKFRSLENRKSTGLIVLHHLGATSGTVEGIHNYHLSLGWAGIGYHFYIRKDGTIYRGRPEATIGAHCYNHNSVSIGICFEGNFEVEDTMSDTQMQSGIELLGYLRDKYGSDIEVRRHKDYNSTDCPGQYFPFDSIVNGSPAPASDVLPMLQNDSTGDAVSTLQSDLNTIRTSLGLGYSELSVDGIFGACTDAAVREFQAAVGISVDGIVGPDTWAHINDALTQSTPTPDPEPTSDPTPAPVQPSVLNAGDALTALQASVGKITLEDEEKAQLDVDADGQITASDALKILQGAVGKI